MRKIQFKNLDTELDVKETSGLMRSVSQDMQVPDPSGGFGGAGTPPEWAGSSPEHTILGVPYDEAVMNHEMRVEEDADS